VKRVITHGAVFFIFFATVLAFFKDSEAAPLKRPFSFEQVTQREGLSGEMVCSIAVQGEEVWFGTYSGGANLYHRAKKTWKVYTTKGESLSETDDGNTIQWKNLPSYNHVSVILPDGDRIWFGTYFYGFGGGGISYYDPLKTPPWKRFSTNHGVAKKIVSMAADRDRLWVGSEKGLSVLDKTTEKWESFYSAQDGLSGNFVNALLIQSGFLWVGTNGGISRFHKAQKVWKTYSEKEGLTGEIKSLQRVGQKIWAGTAEGALFEYDPSADRWKKVEPTDPLKNSEIQSILTTEGKVFICRDHGVSVYDLSTGHWESITTSSGLLSNMVLTAAEDKDGIWFGTDKGASRLILTP